MCRDGVYYPLGCGSEQSEGEYQEQQAMCDEALEPGPERWSTQDERTVSEAARGWSDRYLVKVMRATVDSGCAAPGLVSSLAIEIRSRGIDEEGEPVWTTKDGRRLRPAEMDDRHLVNTVLLLDRNLCAWVERTSREVAAIGGEMAREAAEREVLDRAVCPGGVVVGHRLWAVLEAEVARRGLGEAVREGRIRNTHVFARRWLRDKMARRRTDG